MNVLQVEGWSQRSIMLRHQDLGWGGEDSEKTTLEGDEVGDGWSEGERTTSVGHCDTMRV